VVNPVGHKVANWRSTEKTGEIMRRVLALLLTLGLVIGSAQRATAIARNCGDGMVDLFEQCDGVADASCPGSCDANCLCPPVTTIDIPSEAEPPNTPGSPGVTVTNEKLLTQFGGPSFGLNNARYTRFELDDSEAPPDAILILVPGFLGGANNFRIMAQNLLTRVAADHDMRIEVWAVDRRSNQLEDTSGLDIAEAALDPILAGNWLFGEELSLPLDPRLTRRAVFYNPQDDVPFIANWTNLVFSRDIDAIVEAARGAARNGNVFLGGHSAGTGFTARYASTDLNIAPGCAGTPEPGYAKLRGLVLLEGGGGTTAGADAVTDDTLDRVVAKFDGGLFGAVRDNAPRCVDGTTPCTVDSEATDCAGQTPPVCTPPTTAYSIVPGALNPRVLASSEATSLQSVTDLNTGRIVGQLDLGTPGNNAVNKVPDLAPLVAVPPATVAGGFGFFLNKNGAIAQALTFLAMSVGAPGPTVDGILTWQDILHPPLPEGPNLGPPPTMLPATRWGIDKEVTRIDRALASFFSGQTNFSDWYYPASGLSTTSGLNLDTRKLSAPPPLGRGRCDIENLTQAANIDIPVIAFSASAGSAPVPGNYTAFASSIGTCTAPSCDSTTPRVVDAANPNPAFPTFGDVAGGFEVYVNEGFAHLDVLTAEDNADNHVLEPLADFIARNVDLPQPIPCVGDCNGDGNVTVDEMVRGIGITLGTIEIEVCEALDCQGTGSTSISCVIQAVNNAIAGCPD
jgi:pimeloyl-ACP methyl ester carboxylesterase